MRGSGSSYIPVFVIHAFLLLAPGSHRFNDVPVTTARYSKLLHTLLGQWVVANGEIRGRCTRYWSQIEYHVPFLINYRHALYAVGT